MKQLETLFLLYLFFSHLNIEPLSSKAWTSLKLRRGTFQERCIRSKLSTCLDTLGGFHAAFMHMNALEYLLSFIALCKAI